MGGRVESQLFSAKKLISVYEVYVLSPENAGVCMFSHTQELFLLGGRELPVKRKRLPYLVPSQKGLEHFTSQLKLMKLGSKQGKTWKNHGPALYIFVENKFGDSDCPFFGLVAGWGKVRLKIKVCWMLGVITYLVT